MDVSSRLTAEGKVDNSTLAKVGALVVEKNISYEDALIECGIAKDDVRLAYAAEYGVPSYPYDKDQNIPASVLNYLAEDSARHYKILPLAVEDGVLVVAANNPDDLRIREVLNFVSSRNNLPYKLVFMLASDLEKAQQAYDSLTGEVDEALSSLSVQLDDQISETKNEDSLGERPETAHFKEDAPVTKIVATILRFAVDGGASDIHIEPNDKRVEVRFRVDGLLQKSIELPLNVLSAVVARIKILANARLDEKRRPQDGRFSANFGKHRIDFRVSILPTNHGEKVVMRILDNERGVTNLDETGISSFHRDAIREILEEPYGIILISGPTGSGKSTTLYSMLGEVDRATKNVMSLEDPVEYNIDGVSQSQIKPEIGYTFASGLRSALRQDPDIIMVGEIRDKETAQLAIQAALTGHLVFSTIHTNNSIGVIPRLIDMGVDPYLIAPTLKVALAQRLARRLVPETGKDVTVDGAIQMMVDNEFSTLPTQYRGIIPSSTTMKSPEPSPGSASGTKGRVAVMELFKVDNEIQELILNNGSEEDMYKAARANGFISLKEDAIIKALEHVIPYEEVNAFGTQVGGGGSILDEPETSTATPGSTDVPIDIATPAQSDPAVDNLNSDTVINV